MKPGCSTSIAKIERNALKRQTWLPDGSQDLLLRRGRRFLVIFGSPLGPPKRQKNDFFSKKVVPGSPFLMILAAYVVSVDFLADFGSILDENSMEDLMVFPGCSPIFSNMTTLTKHCIL